MALSGVHFVCGYAGGEGKNNRAYAILGNLEWSETLTSAGTTTNVVPGPHETFGESIVRIRASADSYVAFGKTPDASQTIGNSKSTARTLVPAGDERDFYPGPFNKIAWVLA